LCVLSQIGFYAECGSDNICHPSVSLNISSVESKLPISSRNGSAVRFTIHNQGEPAYTVNMSVQYPTQLQYRQVIIVNSTVSTLAQYSILLRLSIFKRLTRHLFIIKIIAIAIIYC